MTNAAQDSKLHAFAAGIKGRREQYGTVLNNLVAREQWLTEQLTQVKNEKQQLIGAVTVLEQLEQDLAQEGDAVVASAAPSGQGVSEGDKNGKRE